jgi:hypothetical protein
VADWLEHTVLPAAIAAAVLLLVLWPTTNGGRRLLRTWGVPDPRPDQVAAAVRYLWQRRILYVVLFLAVPSLYRSIVGSDAPGVGLFVPLLVAMLIAELLATLRPVSGVRVASLAPRGWRDLVPRWAVWVMAVMVVLAAGLAVLGLTRERGLPTTGLTSAFALGYLVVCLVVVGLLVHLAVRRPAVADEEVDAALRTRSARVAVGIGFGWVGTAANIAGQRVNALEVVGRTPRDPNRLMDVVQTVVQTTGLVVLAASIVCWLWVAVPSRRSLVRR